MEIITKTELSTSDKKELCEIWNQVYPEHIAHKTVASFEAYLYTLNNTLHHIIYEGHSAAAWAVEFDREGERWFAMLIANGRQRRGIGRHLLEKIQNRNKLIHGWVIDHDEYQLASGRTYYSPMVFYLKCGFEILPDQRLETSQISAVKIRWRLN
jgi:GNAT superfamily N-acetyltransferase